MTSFYALVGLLPAGGCSLEVLNVATEDYLTVLEIADLVAERLGLEGVDYRLGEGARGWKGDVPVVRFDTSRAGARLVERADVPRGDGGVDRRDDCPGRG